MKFSRAEEYVLWLTGTALLACACLAYAKSVTIDLNSFAFPVACNLAMLAVGQFYRIVRPDERIAAVITAISFLMFSGMVFSLLTYLQLPYRVHGGDQFIAKIDALLGFHWASIVVVASKFPLFCDLLKQVYLSCAWQIAGTILALGLAKRLPEIGKFTLSLLIGAAITVQIWALFPTSTPAAFQPLPEDVAQRLGLVVSPDQGAWLAQISYNGLATIGHETMVGIVGFPSYHTVLALTTLYFSRHVPIAHVPIALLTFLMVPAILIHGSHNLTDIFGGIAVTAVSIAIARKLVDGRQAKTNSMQMSPTSI